MENSRIFYCSYCMYTTHEYMSLKTHYNTYIHEHNVKKKSIDLNKSDILKLDYINKTSNCKYNRLNRERIIKMFNEHNHMIEERIKKIENIIVNNSLV